MYALYPHTYIYIIYLATIPVVIHGGSADDRLGCIAVAVFMHTVRTERKINKPFTRKIKILQKKPSYFLSRSYTPLRFGSYELPHATRSPKGFPCKLWLFFFIVF